VVLAAMPKLRNLRLSGTKVRDIQGLQAAPALKSLSVVNTKVSGSALAALKAKGITVYGGGDGP
jgi:hypothetical protein